jgi:hypothetical protein
MSHVNDPLVWTEGVFAGSSREASQLVLKLKDGTSRYMNYENWNDATAITEKKLSTFSPGTRIRIATWSTYDPEVWFCDVEEMRS